MLTIGDILDDDKKALIEEFIRSGKGFVGVHSASDTEREWPWFTQLDSCIVAPQIPLDRHDYVRFDFPGIKAGQPLMQFCW